MYNNFKIKKLCYLYEYFIIKFDKSYIIFKVIFFFDLLLVYLIYYVYESYYMYFIDF